MNVIDQTHMRPAISKDFVSVVRLLQNENLPTEDLPVDLSHFFVIEQGKNIIAVAGIEVYGKDGLLRSLVVDQHNRNRSLATTLLNKLLLHAAEKGIGSVYLITTTAEKYFAAKKFSVINRAEVPSSISLSQEFSKLCPSTATVMRKDL